MVIINVNSATERMKWTLTVISALQDSVTLFSDYEQQTCESEKTLVYSV